MTHPQTRLFVLFVGAAALFAGPAFAQRTPPPSPAATTTPANPEHERLKLEAENAYQTGDFAKCIDLTGRVLAQNPRDHVALYLRASARVELGSARRDVKEVRAGVEDARESMRHGGTELINYYLPYFYGMTALAQLENRKDHANVVVQFAGTILSRTTLKPEEKANILYQRATAYVFQQNFDAASRDFEAAVALVPTHLGARLGLADTYLQLKRPDKAEATYTAAVQASPNNPLVYNNRGMFFQQQGKLQNAIADFTRAIEMDNTYAVAYTNRGFAAMAEGNPVAAEGDFTASLKVDANQPLVYSLRGTSRLSQGNPKGAVEDYGQVLKIDSRNPIAQADLGFAKYFSGDYAGAITAFDQAVSMDANLRYLNPWRFWSMAKAGQAQSATTKFAKELNAVPDKRDWVDALLSFIAGRISDQDLVKAVEQKDAMLRQAQLCEAYYFMAEKKIQSGDAPAATQLYQQTLETKQAHLSAYRGAQYALKSFPKQPGGK